MTPSSVLPLDGGGSGDNSFAYRPAHPQRWLERGIVAQVWHPSFNRPGRILDFAVQVDRWPAI